MSQFHWTPYIEKYFSSHNWLKSYVEFTEFGRFCLVVKFDWRLVCYLWGITLSSFFYGSSEVFWFTEWNAKKICEMTSFIRRHPQQETISWKKLRRRKSLVEVLSSKFVLTETLKLTLYNIQC